MSDDVIRRGLKISSFRESESVRSGAGGTTLSDCGISKNQGKGKCSHRILERLLYGSIWVMVTGNRFRPSSDKRQYLVQTWLMGSGDKACRSVSLQSVVTEMEMQIQRGR